MPITQATAARMPRGERVTVTGVLDPGLFVPWIARYAAKLGLACATVAATRSRIELDVVGDAALVEMLAIGCSLGPSGTWVDTVDRRPDHHAPGN